MNVDFEVDDILAPAKKKGIKSGPKGKRAERLICKSLISRFQEILSKNPAWGLFSRSIGSGNRWGQGVVLSKQASNTFSGDITCPENFKFVIESKSGYNEIDLCCAFDGGSKQIDDFLDQVSGDAKRTGRKPMLIWRKDRKPALVFLKTGEIPVDKEFIYTMKYRDWTIYLFEDMISMSDDFFFSE
jgi:hypothetical protein